MSEPTASLMLPSAVANNLPSMVRNELSKMSASSQSAFLEDYRRKEKSTLMAYVFLFFFGVVFGCHYGYLGRWGKQLLFWFTFGGVGVWALLDVFRLPSIVADYNKDVATDVMRNLKAIAA